MKCNGKETLIMVMSNKYPLKFGVLYVLAKENKAVTLKEVMDDLAPVYGKELSFTKKNIMFHLDSMVGIDMVKMVDEHIDDKGELAASYEITPFGWKRTELLPKEYRSDLS